MKKVVLTGIKRMEVIDAPMPEIVKDTDVLIKMSVVGVCGSDIHYYDTGRIGSQIVEYPFAVGHEGAGVVAKVGSAVTAVKVGDRIAVEPSIACGECDQCKAGRENTCRNNLFLGCPGQIEGNLQEYMVMPESQCLKIEDHMTPDDGANSEPLAIGLYANKIARLDKDATIGILGFGPIGMSVMLMAKALGFKNFFVSEKIDERSEMAKATGAKAVFNPNSENVTQSLTAKEPLLLDAVFECCGKQDALDTAFEIVKPGGKIIIVGIPEFDKWTFSADVARRKEITIFHCRRQNHCTEETLELLAKGKVDANLMVTHRFTLDKTKEAFDLVSNYQDGVMKAMIDFNH